MTTRSLIIYLVSKSQLEAHFRSSFEILAQVIFRMYHRHRCPAQNVGRANKTRVARLQNKTNNISLNSYSLTGNLKMSLKVSKIDDYTKQVNVLYLLAKLFDIVNISQLPPLRLDDFNIVKHSRELEAVFGVVDELW